MHFSEIIKFQFEKERQTFLRAFYKYNSWIIFESAWLPPIFFLDCIIINRGKNTFELVGTVLKITELRYYILYEVKEVKILCFAELSTRESSR